MDWIFILGLILLIVGGLAVLGIRLLPIKKNLNWIFIIVGILIVTGLGMSLWSGITSLAVVGAGTPASTSTTPGAQYAYSVIATKGVASELIDSTNKVITVPTNGTDVTATTVNANFTIGITDAYADMRGVVVSCNTNSFLTQNVSASDSTQYLIVTKDSAGLADIRIADSTGTYLARSRTFLLGGQSSTGQSVVVTVKATIDTTSLGKVNTYNSIPISCNVAGQSWTIGVERISP